MCEIVERQKCRSGTGIIKTVSERKPSEGISVARADEIPSVIWGLKCRNGTGIRGTEPE